MLSVSSKKFLTLKIFHLLIKKFSQGEKALNARQIAEVLEIPVRLVRELLSTLTGPGLVVETAKGTGPEVTFQPGRTIENIRLKHALDAFEQYGSTRLPALQSDEEEKISSSLKDISEIIETSPGNVILRDI
jgi:DNA-binding IscR family transcriptional regulator